MSVFNAQSVIKYGDFIMRPGNTDLYAFDVEILRHGQVRLDASWRSNNAKNYYTRLYFIKSGSGYLQEGNKTVPLEPGSVYLIPSEHDFGFGCTELEKIFFHILLPAGEKTDILEEIGAILVLPDSQELIDALYSVYGSNDAISLMRVKMLLYNALDRLITRYNLQFSCNRELSKLSSDALRYIWDHMSVKLSVREIAQKLYVSESALRNAFKADVGIALGKYIDNAVFFTVRKYLTAGIPIEEIAQKLGFCDRHYLSRRFKERFGKTISQYRKDQLI